MRTTPLRGRAFWTGAAVAAACTALGWLPAGAATAALAEVAPCQPVIAATAKQVTLPTHMYMTETRSASPGKTTRAETIYTGDAIYIQVNGTWRRSSVTPGELQRQQADNQRSATAMTCRHLRDEAVNGEAAAVYSEHNESADAKTDSTIWISKGRGVPLRLEMDMDVGGLRGKSHIATRYEYGAVQPPPGVR
jgi:hypothetical protein